MFERYTEKARRAIFYARFEASESGTPRIEPEHVLLGLLRENKEFLAKLLQVPEPAPQLRRKISQRLPSAEKISTSVELPLSAAKSVLKRAHEESEMLGHRHIGAEHLLLGVLGECGSLAAEVVEESGVKMEEVRERIASGEAYS